jgi:hypothetical protein
MVAFLASQSTRVLSCHRIAYSLLACTRNTPHQNQMAHLHSPLPHTQTYYKTIPERFFLLMTCDRSAHRTYSDPETFRKTIPDWFYFTAHPQSPLSSCSARMVSYVPLPRALFRLPCVRAYRTWRAFLLRQYIFFALSCLAPTCTHLHASPQPPSLVQGVHGCDKILL